MLNSPLEGLRFLKVGNLENTVLNILVVLRILLTLAVTVATAERSFIKLKLIKTFKINDGKQKTKFFSSTVNRECTFS